MQYILGRRAMSTNEEKIQESLAKIKAKKNNENEKIVLPKVDLSGIEKVNIFDKKEKTENEEPVGLARKADFSEVERVNFFDKKEKTENEEPVGWTHNGYFSEVERVKFSEGDEADSDKATEKAICSSVKNVLEGRDR